MRHRMNLFALFNFVVLVSILPVTAFENVATIGYEPAELSAADQFSPPEGVSFDPYTLRTIDGELNAAGLWQSQEGITEETTLVIAIHGSGGSYLANPIKGLGNELASRGIAVLATNTRQHDDRVNTDNFFDIRKDIDAAVYMARSLGFTRIVLAGHSLGNIQVQFYAATNWDEDIKGVALLSMFGDLPWKSRNILIRNADNYDQLTEEARDAVDAGTANATLPTEMGYVGGTTVPVTAEHFLTYRREDVSSADGTYWIRRIPQPILLLRDAGDAVSLTFETDMLISASRGEASLSSDLTNIVIPNGEAPSPAAHVFATTLAQAADEISGWMETLP